VDVDVLAVAGHLLAAHVAQLFHYLERGEGARLHDPGLVAQLALREAVALPQDAQESPMSERHRVLGEPRLHGAREGAPRLLGQVREAV